MSQPGTGDFQSISCWRGTPMINQFPMTIAVGGYIGPTTPMGDFAALELHVNAQSQGLQVVTQFYADSAATFPVEATDFIVPAGVSLDVQVPAVGDYVVVELKPPSGLGATANVCVTPTNLAVGGYKFTAPGGYLSEQSVSVPAVTTDLYPLPSLVGGWASLNYDPAGAGAHLDPKIVVLHQDGTAGDEIWHVPTPTAPVQANILLPLTAVALQVANSDSAGHSFTATLIPQFTG